MITHHWTVFCSDYSVDNDSNNVSLYNVIEQIGVAAPEDVEWPINVARNGKLISMVSRSVPDAPEQGFLRVEYLSPNDDVIFKSDSPVDLSDNVRFRHIVNLIGLPIAGVGWHHFQISVGPDEEHLEVVKRLPLDVRLIEGP